MPRILSLDKSLSLLEAVLDSPEGIGTRALTKRLGYNVATVHNIATTFCQRGYLYQDPATKHFLPGARLALMGRRQSGLQQLVHLAAPIVDEAAERLTESVLLGYLDHDTIINLRYVPSRQALRAQEPEDVSKHAHCTAFGKVLLAQLSKDGLTSYLERVSLQAFTARSITTIPMLLEELKNVRDLGYARTLNEYSEGVSAVAVPIKDPWGAVVASIGASAPTLRMQKESQFTHSLESLQLAARAIEEAWSKTSSQP